MFVHMSPIYHLYGEQIYILYSILIKYKSKPLDIEFERIYSPFTSCYAIFTKQKNHKQRNSC